MRRRRQNESGYALLLVFAMAAAVAVKLYLELPRVAFEHQRNKEGLLVERGEEFVRAIKLYYRKNQRWPQNLEELEKTQETRYLRKRYKDPMTGQDEWRLVHVDGAGQFTDSLVHKKPGEGEETGPSLLAARVQGIGASAEVIDPGGEAGSNNPALQRRASDRIIPGTTSDGAQDSNALPGEGGDNRPREGVPVPPEGGNPRPGIADIPSVPGQVPVRNPQGGRPGAPVDGSQGTASGSSFGMSGGFGFGGAPSTSAPSSPQPGTARGGPGGFVGGMAGGPGGTQGGSNAQGQPNEALRLINQILSSPRPGAQQGGAFGAAGRGTGVATGIGGLAGVASKKDMDGIMVYNEQTNYKKWEFIYDLKKEMQARGMGGNQLPGQAPNPAGQTGTGQGQQRPGANPGSVFGSGSGGQSGTGNTGQQQRPPGGSGFGFGKQ